MACTASTSWADPALLVEIIDGLLTSGLMARSCTACGHAARASIDEALIAGVGSNRRIAAQHGLIEQSVPRQAR